MWFLIQREIKKFKKKKKRRHEVKIPTIIPSNGKKRIPLAQQPRIPVWLNKASTPRTVNEKKKKTSKWRHCMLWLDNWGWVGRDTQTKMIFSKYSMSMCFHTWKGGVVYWQRGEGPDSRHIAFHVADLISAVCDVWQSWFIWFISIYKVCEPMLPWVSHIIFFKSYFCFKAGI